MKWRQKKQQLIVPVAKTKYVTAVKGVLASSLHVVLRETVQSAQLSYFLEGSLHGPVASFLVQNESLGGRQLILK